VPFEIIKHGIHIDFIGKRRIALIASISVLAAGLLAAAVNGIKVGIDFAGGTEIQVRFDPSVSVGEGEIRAIVNEVEGIEEASVVRYGEPEANEFLIKFRAALGERGSAAEAAEGISETEAIDVVETEDVDVVETPAAEAEETETVAEAEAEAEAVAVDVESGLEEVIETASDMGPTVDDGTETQDKVDLLDDAFGEMFGAHTIERVEFVGPRVGAELRDDGFKALAFAAFAILLYIWFRFSSRFAPGAIVAVIHDLSITAAIFVILGLEFDLRILAAMLAILGYSLNDTIIIYDRIRENMELRTKADLKEVLNLSINQTLSRTVLTSATTLVALVALLVLGGQVIWSFAFAMILGVIVGTYSSVYVAGATLLLIEEKFAKN
jgi:preprotein translocase subunit SecF